MYDIEFKKYLSQKTNVSLDEINILFDEAKEDVFEVAKILIKDHKFDKEKLGKIWGDYMNFAYVNPKNVLTNDEYIKEAGFDFVKQKKIVPVYKLGKAITIATGDPLNPFLQDQLERIWGSLVNFVFCFPFDVDELYKDYDPYAAEKAAAKKAEEEKIEKERLEALKKAEEEKAEEEKEQKKDTIDKLPKGSQSRQFLINLRKIQNNS